MEDEYLLIKTDALPEVYARVVQAKRLLSTGEAASSSEAARLAGISRSAYYKYKDVVWSYDGAKQQRVITVHAVLEDSPGVLAAFMAVLCDAKANILTVNQNIPVNGAASASVSASIEHLTITISQLLSNLSSLPGVISIDNVAG